VSRALFLIANQMSQRAYQNLQLTHTISDLGRAEAIINRSPAVAFHRKREPGWPVTFVTQNVEQLLEYSSEEFLSGRVAYQDALHPEDTERVQEEVARNIRDKGIREFALDPYRVVTRSGVVKWVEDITRVIRNAEGDATEFEGIVIDISERKRMETEKAALELQLQRAQKMELVGTLAGGVAHDLNNILGAIVGYPDLLLLDLPEGSLLRKPIEAMRRTGERAADIVQDLLTLARRGVVVKDVSNLNDVVAGYLESPEHRRLLAAHPGVETETDLEPDLLNILGSRAHLSKTVMNVVTNAAEAMPGGGTIRICTENVYLDRRIIEQDNVQEGDYAVLKISDQGEGISPEDTERIFEPFYTKKTMGKSGTGLGMAVVWGTVKDHKGYITLESTRGKGTCFYLYFPVTRRDLPLADGTLPVDAYQGSGERILVIDDVAEQRDVAAALLERLGYSVSTASSGEEALEYLQKNPADLLLLDMIMDPGWDGLQTYRKIVEKHPGQKAVIASGFSETTRVREAQKLGAGRYIKKPYTLAKLGAAVQSELARRPPARCSPSPGAPG
jgi:two-component system, cell cycle sensor histidine kinase and response regulator CckA